MISRNLKKEFIGGIRENRFLTLIAGFLFFAMLTPVMMKFMPDIMKSQFPNLPAEAISSMMDISQFGCVQSYMGDVFEIGTIIVAFVLCGVISQELKDNLLVLPVCSGKSFSGIILSKLIVFGIALTLLPLAALLIDYAYAGMILGFDMPSVMPVIRGGLLQGLFMVFILSCLLMFGVFIKRPVATGLLTLIIVYGSHFIGGLFNLADYMPSGVMFEAAALSEKIPDTLIKTVIITVVLIVLFNLAAIWRLKNMELNKK